MSKATKAAAEKVIAAGCKVQIDHSGGQGHCWRDATPGDVPASVLEEIEGEVIDGGKEECDDFVAGNGQHYRWS